MICRYPAPKMIAIGDVNVAVRRYEVDHRFSLVAALGSVTNVSVVSWLKVCKFWRGAIQLNHDSLLGICKFNYVTQSTRKGRPTQRRKALGLFTVN